MIAIHLLEHFLSNIAKKLFLIIRKAWACFIFAWAKAILCKQIQIYLP